MATAASDDWSHDKDNLLDKLLQARNHYGALISLKVRRKIALGLRTAWSFFICMFIMEYWQWTTLGQYISPVLSILSSTMYFGAWQESMFKVFYSTVICTAIGVVVGLAYEREHLQIAMFFICVAWIGRFPGWDRLTLVMGTLSFMLGAVWPNLTAGKFTGLKTYHTVFAIQFIPFLITGASLLFPRPALATYHARLYALMICRKLSQMITAVVKAFLSYDDVDVCCAEFDQYHSEIMADIGTLKVLTRHVDHERILFHSISGMPRALQLLMEIVDAILEELVGMKEMVKRISFNKTHERFAEKQRADLISMVREMAIALAIVGEHFDSFDPWKGLIPITIRKAWGYVFKCECWSDHSHALRFRMSKFMNIPSTQDLLDHRGRAGSVSCDRDMNEMEAMPQYSFTKADLEQGHFDHPPTLSQASHNTRDTIGSVADSESANSMQSLFHETMTRLSKARSRLLYHYSEVRREYIFHTDNVEDNNDPDITPSAIEAVASLLHEERSFASEGLRSRSSRMDSSETSIKLAQSEIDKEIRRQHLIKLSVKEETMRLSLRNFGARGAYMHRVSMVIEYIASLQHTLVDHDQHFNILYFLWSGCAYPFLMYFPQLFLSLVATAKYCQERFYASTNLFAFLYEMVWLYLNTYSTTLKAASILTLCTSIMMFKLMPFLYNGGLWMSLVVIIIRQDIISSSFLTSVQRLEGTVVGAMYAVLVYIIFSCDSKRCGYWVNIPSMTLWVFVCGCFRDGPMHGYSATVASFTPAVIILGHSNDIIGAAWGRIEETFIGIGIYLIIDNVFFPKRIYPSVKASVLQCIEHTRVVFNECVQGVQYVVKLENCSTPAASDAPNTATSIDQVKISNNNQDGLEEDKADGLGIYGEAADLRYRMGSVASEILLNKENTGSGRYEVDDPFEETDQKNTVKDNEDPIEETAATMELVVSSSIVASGNVPKSMQEILVHCSKHFVTAEKRLNIMRGELVKQSTLLGFAPFEPELWHRSFPVSTYQKLLEAFKKVWRSGLALNIGSKAFTVVMCQIIQREQVVTEHLVHFNFMINHLFIISAKANEAMIKAHEAFSKLYSRANEEVDVSSLLSLRRVCDKLSEAVEEHFRVVLLRLPSDVLTAFNPYFLVAWQNVFESAQDLIKDLSELGMTLLMVRNIEGLLQL
eukprot:gene7533-8332_t